MRLIKDRCINCSNPQQHSFIETGTPYWVCSSRCYDDLLKPYLDKRWQAENFAKDPEMVALERDVCGQDYSWDVNEVRALIDALTEKLHAQKNAARAVAHDQFIRRLRAEWDKQRGEDREKQREQEQKEMQREQERQERERLRQERERERQERQAERDRERTEAKAERDRITKEREADRKHREQQRLEEKQERERERFEREEQKRLEQEAEEEKWRPRPFKL